MTCAGWEGSATLGRAWHLAESVASVADDLTPGPFPGREGVPVSESVASVASVARITTVGAGYAVGMGALGTTPGGRREARRRGAPGA